VRDLAKTGGLLDRTALYVEGDGGPFTANEQVLLFLKTQPETGVRHRTRPVPFSRSATAADSRAGAAPRTGLLPSRGERPCPDRTRAAAERAGRKLSSVRYETMRPAAFPFGSGDEARA
jgi:hypothetical protein